MTEHKPIYPYSFEESERNGETELYKNRAMKILRVRRRLRKRLQKTLTVIT